MTRKKLYSLGHRLWDAGGENPFVLLRQIIGGCFFLYVMWQPELNVRHALWALFLAAP